MTTVTSGKPPYDLGEEIGEQVWIRFYRTATTERAGLIETHIRPDGQYCNGFVPFAGRDDSDWPHKWEVVSDDPLTLKPSIECSACGKHGFIREGKWVPV